MLDNKGYGDQATAVVSAIDLVALLHSKTLSSDRQSTINKSLQVNWNDDLGKKMHIVIWHNDIIQNPWVKDTSL